MSQLFEYIDDLPITEHLGDGVVKTASLRKMIMCLPSPENVARDEALIPDLDVKLVLSVSGFMPEYIAEKVSLSHDRIIFNDDRLQGLCVSGRRLPIEIFLPIVRLNKDDPSGALLGEKAWHEIVHAIEGIWLNEEGKFIRDNNPWSFRLQQDMIAQDDEELFQSALRKSPRTPQTIRMLRYLKQGTDLQDHVSEVFARVATLYLKNVRDTGQDASAQGRLFIEEKIKSTFNQKVENVDIDAVELRATLGVFSKPANALFWENADEMVRRISMLYGCRTSSQAGPEF